jgi:hypothetical protein
MLRRSEELGDGLHIHKLKIHILEFSPLQTDTRRSDSHWEISKRQLRLHDSWRFSFSGKCNECLTWLFTDLRRLVWGSVSEPQLMTARVRASHCLAFPESINFHINTVIILNICSFVRQCNTFTSQTLSRHVSDSHGHHQL